MQKIRDRYVIVSTCQSLSVGDAYVAVCGAPDPCARHVENICNLAIDMMASLQEVQKLCDLQYLELRAGINTGPIRAGIVGKRSPKYQLVGDTYV